MSAPSVVDRKREPRDIFMVHVGPTGSVFVKELEFFRSQGGFRESWGEGWVPLVARDLEHARERGLTLPGAVRIAREP